MPSTPLSKTDLRMTAGVMAVKSLVMPICPSPNNTADNTIYALQEEGLA